MSNSSKFTTTQWVRLFFVALAGLFLASCSTSAVSTNNSSLGKPIAAKASKAKVSPWKAAQARYKKRMDAFRAKQKARIQEIKDRRAERKAARIAKLNAKKGKKVRTASKKSRKKSRFASRKKASSRKNQRASKKNIRAAKKRIAKLNAPKGKIRMARVIRARAPWKCLPNRLKSVMNKVAKRYGRLTINSTYRSPRHNRRVGGARRSWHKKCAAVDFRVHGKHRGLTRYLRNHPYVGGLKRYRSGYYHIDTGPRRTW